MFQLLTSPVLCRVQLTVNSGTGFEKKIADLIVKSLFIEGNIYQLNLFCCIAPPTSECWVSAVAFEPCQLFILPNFIILVDFLVYSFVFYSRLLFE
jgi:hypothetical protein